MISTSRSLLGALAALFSLVVPSQAPRAAVPAYDIDIVATYPHDPSAFTEGLFYRDGALYESTGQTGRSSIRKVELQTGKVIKQHTLDGPFFGEGIAAWRGRLMELTWQDHVGFLYDLDSFKRLGQFHVDGEGWGLTDDGAHLIMSDGTSDLRLLDPNSLAVTGRIHVTCEGRHVRNINELEWVKGEVYANIWITNLIARIDPSTGAVVGAIDLSKLAALNPPDPPDKVPNGIAYDAGSDRLFVTGKLWPALYQIRVLPSVTTRDVCRIIE